MTSSGQDITSSCVGNAITFSNTSGRNGDNLTWSYNNNTVNGNSFLYSFTNQGTYTITLKDNSNNESVSKVITIYSNPTTTISVSQSNICTGNSVTFSANATTTSSIKNYIWSFGDGSSVTQNNTANHSYNQAGNYNAYLYVEDINGCRSPASSTKTVSVIGSLNVGFTANGTDYFSCSNQIDFENTTLENGTLGIVYTWDFGDGTSSTEKNPGNHTYATAGKYTVKILANIPGNNSCTPGFTKDIYVGKPSIQIVLSNTSICANTSTSIKANITPSSFFSKNQDIIWQSNNASFNKDSTAINFTNAGSYTLSATNQNGCKSTTTTTINVNASPSATINITPSYGICTETNIKYGITNTSTSTSNLSYSWDFGDGTISTNETLEHKYDTAGSYITTLKLSNSNGCTSNFTQVITVTNKCIDNGLGSTYNPSFGFASISCDNKNILKFYNKDSLLKVSSWIIDNVTYPSQGDTTVIKLPTKSTEDTYNVQVKYTNGTFDKVREITIIDEVANFTYSNSDNTNNLLCAFNNITFDASAFVNTSNLNGQYAWEIKDVNGKTVEQSTTSSPTFSNYIFDSTGNYTISLLISDIRTPACTSSISKIISIKGSIMDFEATKTTFCNTHFGNVTYLNLTRATEMKNIKYTWSFGDGESRNTASNETSILKTYNSPNTNFSYSVQLTASDMDGCSSYLYKPYYLNINNPYASFSTSDTILCSSKKIIIQNNSDASTPSTYLWTVGKYSKTYQNRSDLNINVNIDSFPQTFDVNLKVTDAVGCTKDTTIKNYIKFQKPKASFTIVNSDLISTCPPYTLQLKNTSTSSDSTGVWRFSDGTSDLGDTSIYYSVLHPGYNTINLINYGYDGCIDSTSQTIKVKGPIAKLRATDTIGCLPLKTNFQVATSDSIVSYQWALGDGTNFNSSSIKSYSYNYTNRGNYWPTVLVIGGPEEGGCTDLLTLNDSIIANTQYPKIDIVNKEVICTLDTATFINVKDTLGFQVKKYTWHWNDGSQDQITDIDSIKHVFYGKNQTYPIYLTAETEYCTVSSDTLNVAYHLKPVVNFESPNELCKNDSLHLLSSVTNTENSDNNFKWYMGDSLIYTGKDSTYSNLLPYLNFNNLKLIVQTESGCSDSIIKPINLLDLPSLTFKTLQKFCTGDSISINTTSDATSFKWTPTLYITNDSVQSPIIFPDSTKTFYVNLVGANSCKNTDSILVPVDQKVGLTFIDNYNYCISDSSNLSLNANAINTNQFLWSSIPSTGYMSSDSGSSINVKPITTTTYKVVAISQNTCPDEYGNILVNAYQRPEISFASKIISIGAGEYFYLNPQINHNNSTLYHYQWLPTTGLDNPYSENPKAISDQDITYTLNISSNFGCAASDSITVKVLCSSSKLFMANAFTPNGDGKNDRFYVTGYGIKSVEHFIIVDRWGKKMFERNNIMSNDFSQGWDGTTNGKQVEPGTYMYFADIICTEGQKYQLKGSVTLIR
ncbi:PKD domain-containing protein [Rhizosphaericola mali]|nr:PKD domain-containing protein [Rhizosphaericola mali]